MYYIYRSPFLPIENYDLDKDIVNFLPEETCRQHQVIVIDKFEKLYIGTNDFDPDRNPSWFYALNTDGEVEWSAQVGDVDHSSAVIAPDGTLYVGTLDNGLSALSSEGDIKWQLHQVQDIVELGSILNSGIMLLLETILKVVD